ncbi:cytochrome C oxidase subunit III [Mycobacterium sp. CBMA 234]|uniref:cytochrome c oxidase subunit 3 n=1 Tax=Mycolicibacterium sp. CBMA 234 TaxID=1918495 RepID=UPI0012DF4BF3|nr:cytochrome c oxidase subunit 3 [Mycolicibacterium sp. CBMA 234]MUL65840.1 cytochrome C oxidase subunit III [Mycolicibacterium sp. CBMA 234]
MAVIDPVTDAPAPSAAPKQRHIPGELGVWILIFGDMSVFAVLFCVFLNARRSNPAQFAHDQAALNANFGAINTVLLLVSSLCVVMAVRAIRSGAHQALARRFIVSAWLCGVGFLVIKALEYGEKISHGITPQTSEFFMYYFVLTGLHAFHLLIGLGVLGGLFALARKPGMSKGKFAFFEGGACFWHMVDLLWIVLFPLIFLVR